jgi:hypothetical protein
MAGYSSRSLVEKLGITPGTMIVLLGGPPGYAEILGTLPDGVTIVTRLPATAGFVHQFVRRRSELEAALPRLARLLTDEGMLWVSWPRKASRIPGDVTENMVREVALPLGLVDVKVCAVDDAWSGLKLVRRKELRGSKSP